MKQVASLADLHRMALDAGASVEVGGQVFNAGMRRDVTRPAPPPALPIAAPAPATEPDDDADDGIDLASFAAAQDARNAALTVQMQRMAQDTLERVAAAVSAKAAPHGWRFIPKYQRGGQVEHIDAIPLPPEA